MSRGNGTIELATQLLEKYLGNKRASKGLSDMLAASLISEQACPLHNDGGKTYYAEKIATGTCQPRSPSDIYKDRVPVSHCSRIYHANLCQ